MGTRAFQKNLDGSYDHLTDVSTEDGYILQVPDLGPLLVDGWYNEGDENVQAICLHFQREGSEVVQPSDWEYD